MGKGEKTKLGRALVKQHNHMIQESSEKGRFYRKQSKRVLESVTDVSDIDAIIGDADDKERIFSGQHSDVKVLADLDSISEASKITPEDLREQQMEEEALHASSLRVPRRPIWNSQMTVEELDSNERQAFLSWRRDLAKLEENEKLVLTPFEKNLDIWRQLWRVVERSDLLVTVVDARNPLFYRCSDLEAYVREVDDHKRTMLLINKADLLPLSVRESWANYFHLHGILFLFWSAKAASAALEGKNLIMPEESADADADTKIYGREELLARLQSEAEKIAARRTRPGSSMSDKSDSDSEIENSAGTPASVKSVMVGFVGYPNVGKSSTINALVGEKKTGVTSTPGKTKHFQTLIMSDKLTLCDCPGLVFPSFTSSRYEMIASGVLPIDRMTEHREAVQVAANRVPREVFENVYNISLPKPKSYERQSRPPTAAELLRAYCASRGYVSSRGLPDETKASRQILKDYIDGKLPHFQMPPGISDDRSESGDDAEPISSEVHEQDSSDDEYPSDNELIDTPDLEHVLDDMDSFDTANGLVPPKDTKKKPPRAPHKQHKQHKKPQRKKDRTWRVQNGEGDGMPLVRVYQKPVNTGPLNP